MTRLVAVDWGTSSLRGALLDEHGAAIEERSFARGILSVPAGGFPAAFDECFGDWLAREPSLCLVSGMAGSKQGWVEAPYCECPASSADVAGSLRWVEPGRIAIVPGLSCERDGVPDVMRGEETQIFGALKLLGIDSATIVLPGTHSKWVEVRDGRIESFATSMTGEVYALLRKHSILARTLPAEDAAFDGEAFDAGVKHAMRSSGLLESAFSVRTLSLFDRLPEGVRPSYLSGVVIGEELRARSIAKNSQVIVIGSDALTLRYERALAFCGVRATSAGSQAAWRGLHDIAGTLTA